MKLSAKIASLESRIAKIKLVERIAIDKMCKGEITREEMYKDLSVTSPILIKLGQELAQCELAQHLLQFNVIQ